jgi:SAM-dependent methyltransferase
MADAPASPLSTPQPWDLVADGYLSENVTHFERYAADALQLARFADVPEARVVDVAAGPGTLALLAARTAAHVDAIDFAPAMIAHLRRRVAEAGLTNVDARVGDGQALPYPDRSADLAFSLFGLMFFPDRARGFAELRRVLVPGGRAVVSSWKPMDGAPLVAALFGAIAAESPSPGMPQPAQKGPLSDADDLRAEMSAAGFHGVDVVERVHALEWPDFEECWRSASRGFAPLVLMKARLGEAAFAPVADRIRARVARAIGTGPGRSEMPAWLGVGTA